MANCLFLDSGQLWRIRRLIERPLWVVNGSSGKIIEGSVIIEKIYGNYYFKAAIFKSELLIR